MAFRINIPPVTRVLLILLLGFSLVYQAAHYKTPGSQYSLAWIVLRPQLSVYYPWVYITSTLAEQNIITLLIAIATVLYGGKYLERAWGSAEFAKFLLVVTLVPNVIASVLYLLLHVITLSHSLG